MNGISRNIESKAIHKTVLNVCVRGQVLRVYCLILMSQHDFSWFCSVIRVVPLPTFAYCLPSRAQTPRVHSRAINRLQLQQVTLGNEKSAHRCDCELGESRPCPHPASFAYISLATSLPSLGLHFGTRPIEGDDPPLGNGKKSWCCIVSPSQCA